MNRNQNIDYQKPLITVLHNYYIIYITTSITSLIVLCIVLCIVLSNKIQSGFTIPVQRCRSCLACWPTWDSPLVLAWQSVPLDGTAGDEVEHGGAMGSVCAVEIQTYSVDHHWNDVWINMNQHESTMNQLSEKFSIKLKTLKWSAPAMSCLPPVDHTSRNQGPGLWEQRAFGGTGHMPCFDHGRTMENTSEWWPSCFFLI